MSDELQISPDGHYLLDGGKWISVEHVPLRVVGHLAGARLSSDDNFWWNHVADRWQRVADAPASATPPAGPPAAPNPVTTTTPQLEEPPTAEEMKWGRDVLETAVISIVPTANEVAEKVVGLGGDSEAVLKVLEKGTDGIHVLETFGLEGGLVFGGAVASTIIVPFAMWYEAIGANNAGNIEYLRWRIFEPWMHGFIGGLYGIETGGDDELFGGWKQTGAGFVNGMDGIGKRAVTGALIAHYVYNSSSSDVVSEQLTHAQWDQRLNWTHAYQGLEFVLSASN